MKLHHGHVITLALLLCCAWAADAAERVFSPTEILSWQRHSFSGETSYTLIEKAGRMAVHASCTNATASGLFLEEEIDLDATPILEWDWLVEQTFEQINERTKSGDDYPARLYAVDRHRFAMWRTVALNYVWASEIPRGESWENAYQGRAKMVAVRSGSPVSGQWVTERRDLREDFQTHHNRLVSRIHALAVMTDCDDTGKPIEAWYGEIRLLAK